MASRLRHLGLLAVLAILAGCGAPAAEKLEVREARANLFPSSGAVYFTVVNPGPQSDRLLRVETSAALRAETHESVEDKGMMRMVPHPEGFEVPAGGTLELRPGGKHVMLVEPKPSAGAAAIPLTLHFEHAGAVEVRAAVSGAETGR